MSNRQLEAYVEAAANKPLYPRGFITPDGRAVSVRTMANALRTMRAMEPMDDVHGWDWFPVPAAWVRREIQRGIHDRISRRG